MAQPAVLLFDLGGVLVENVGFERLNALLPAPLPDEELKSRWLACKVVRSFELGLSTPRNFSESFVDEWQLRVEPIEFLRAFESWPKGLYPGAADLLRRLRRQYVVACLSNSNAVHWRHFTGFLGHFEFALSSHLLGHAKPDAACFVQALRFCRAEASAVAYFDDSECNVDAARALGFRTFHVNGLREVQRTLAAEGWV